MPYVQVNTSVRLSDAEKHSLCEDIGVIMPTIPGKTRDNTMMCINDGCYMEKSDAKNPVVNLEVRLLGDTTDKIKEEYVGRITKLFEDKLKVSPENTYINIIAYGDWGAGGSFKKASG